MADAQVFVVRVWQWRGRFHATLRAPGAEDLRAFDDPREVGEFLRRACAGGEADGGDRTADQVREPADDSEAAAPRVRGPPP